MSDSLQDIRRKIDALDARLVKLISARAKIAQHVAKIKNGKAVYRPEREAQVLRRVSEINAGPLPASSVRRIYSEIMSACRALEQDLAVCYLGPEGTFSEMALHKHFGRSVNAMPCASIDEAFRVAECGSSAARAGRRSRLRPPRW